MRPNLSLSSFVQLVSNAAWALKNDNALQFTKKRIQVLMLFKLRIVYDFFQKFTYCILNQYFTAIRKAMCPNVFGMPLLFHFQIQTAVMVS